MELAMEKPQQDSAQENNQKIALAKFFETNQIEPSISNRPGEYLVWHILSIETKTMACPITYICRFLTTWASKDISPETSWQYARTHLGQYGIDLDNVILTSSINSIEDDKASLMNTSLKSAASATKISSLIFQSAFISFNVSKPGECIETLKLLSSQTCQTLVLMAQAYQDLKDFDNAQEALLLATEHTPTDGMAWFQLARNSFALNDLAQAWDSINVCKDLFKRDAEVDLLRLMIGLEQFDNQQSTSDDLYQTSVEQLLSINNSEALFIELSSLALKYGSEQWYLFLCKKSDFSNYVVTHGLLGHIGKTMRQLHMLGWHEASIKFNDKLQSVLVEGQTS
jgi:tetratricopeptide (TPR) repeat protein